MAEDSVSTGTVSASVAATAPYTAAQAYRRMMTLFAHGVVWPGLITILLCFLALELTPDQWAKLSAVVPFAVLFYIVPETWLVHRLFAPLGRALEQLQDPRTVDPGTISRGLVLTLNLPYYAFLRVTLLRGPVGALATFGALYWTHVWNGGGFEPWQLAMFPALVVFFACPLYAMIEYFAVSRHVEPLVEHLWRHCAGIEPNDQQRLIAVRLKTKLLYLCLFITALPLLFLASTVFYKVHLLLQDMAVPNSMALMMPMLRWMGGAVLVCIVGAVAVSLLTAGEVSRSAMRLIGAMDEVQRGNLDVDLKILGTDEYADLTRGFNQMTGGLREETQLLEITQALAGELKLDVLIGRIMSAAADLLDADRSTLFIHDAETHELWSRYAEGLEAREIRFPETAGIAGATFSTGQIENIPDAYADPRFRRDVDLRTGFRTRTILCVPIANKAGQRIGVTQVLNKREGHFNLRDERRLRGFAAQVAVTLESARLFDEVLAIKNYNENVLASSTNGVITLDNQRRIVTANAAALSLLGRPPAQIMRKPIAEILCDTNAWVVTAAERAMEEGVSINAVDANLYRPDGSCASVNLTTNPLRNPKNETIGSMLSFEDFTREKRVKSTMSRYMSPEVANRLLEAGDEVLAGQVQTVSILFSDLRGFTTLSEKLGPRETVSQLNEYFAVMVERVFKHSGILDKYIGDAIMALFGSPFTGPQDADNAVATAVDMVRALHELNAARALTGQPPFDIGIGIATGDVVVGNIGSPRRMEYTVIGDSVNLASRLESATKQYGVRVLLSESTLGALKRPAPVREVDRIRVKGQDGAVTVYEAIGHHDEHSFPNIDACVPIYEAGLHACRQHQFNDAIEAFEQVLELNPEDRPSQIHLERCAYYLDHPPAAHWDGVWTLRDK
ncbi:MAG: adenylate/guanylate cyclase domain-containing protein [Panacagrimonas sp.]